MRRGNILFMTSGIISYFNLSLLTDVGFFNKIILIIKELERERKCWTS